MWFGLALSALVALPVVLNGCGGEAASSRGDGEVAYSVSPWSAPRQAGIYLVDRDGGHRTRLTRPAPPDAHEVWWSPTSDLLLFSSMSGEVWTVRVDGSDLRRIGAGNASWSPDGKLIGVGRRGRLEILSAAGRLRKTIVVDGAGGVGTPSWSPDGTQVAFTASSTDSSDAIFVAPVAGTARGVPLPDAKTHVFQRKVQWSPDGRLLAFEVEDEPYHSAIWASRPDGSQRRLLADFAELYGWLPDGSGVICAGLGRDASLQACPADGGTARPLTPAERPILQASDRSHSPDGRRSVTANPWGSIVVSEADGSTTVVTDPAPASFPEWSPDGERLAFVRATTGSGEPSARAWVYVTNGRGTPPRRLAVGEVDGDDARVEWLPGDALLLVEDVGQGSRISVVSADGRTRRLARGQPEKVVAVSRDGSTVAYVRLDRPRRTAAIYVLATRGDAERKIFDIPAPDEYESAEVTDLAWGADGRSLFAVWPVHGADLSETVYTLHELTLAGTAQVVARSVEAGYGIAVSPDGTQVAFVGGRGLELVEPGSQTRRLLVRASTDSTITGPRWSPDGSDLAYLVAETAVDGRLEAVSAEGGETRRLSGPGQLVESFSWRPTAATGH